MIFDGSAVVSTCCFIPEMIGDSSDHEWDVVHLELAVQEKGQPDLRVPCESGFAFPPPRIEAVDVQACNI